MAPDPILPGSRWRHRRSGGIYAVICLSERESDREPLVTYRGDDSRTWTRPVSEWRERFECVDPAASDEVHATLLAAVREARPSGTRDDVPLLLLARQAASLLRSGVAARDALRARVEALEAEVARLRGDLPAGLPALPDGWAWRWDPDDDLTVDLWHGDEHVGWVVLPYAPGDEAGVGRPDRAHEWHADPTTAATALLDHLGVSHLPAGLPALPDGWIWVPDPDDHRRVQLWGPDGATGWLQRLRDGRWGWATRTECCEREDLSNLPTAAAALLRAVGVGGTDAR